MSEMGTGGKGVIGKVLRPVIGKLFGGGIVANGGTYDTDIQSYFDAQATAGNTLSTTKKDAWNTWILAGKAAGWWAKIIEIWSWTEGAAAYNAIGVKGGIGTFTGAGWTHNATNSQGNGTTDYFQTGLNASTCGITISDGLLGFYGGTDVADDIYPIGVFSSTSSLFEARYFGSDDYFEYGDTASRISGPGGDRRGLTICNRDGTLAEILRKTTAGISTIASSSPITPGGTMPNLEIYASGRNRVGAPNELSSGAYSSYFVALGMTESERTNFANETYSLLASLGVSTV